MVEGMKFTCRTAFGGRLFAGLFLGKQGRRGRVNDPPTDPSLKITISVTQVETGAGELRLKHKGIESLLRQTLISSTTVEDPVSTCNLSTSGYIERRSTFSVHLNLPELNLHLLTIF